jgi:hypothetical protein
MQGYLTFPETLDECLFGVDTVFLVWTAPPSAVAPALERIAKHARRIVFLSAPLKTFHPFLQQPNPSGTLAGLIAVEGRPRGELPADLNSARIALSVAYSPDAGDLFHRLRGQYP